MKLDCKTRMLHHKVERWENWRKCIPETDIDDERERDDVNGQLIKIKSKINPSSVVSPSLRASGTDGTKPLCMQTPTDEFWITHSWRSVSHQQCQFYLIEWFIRDRNTRLFSSLACVANKIISKIGRRLGGLLQCLLNEMPLRSEEQADERFVRKCNLTTP